MSAQVTVTGHAAVTPELLAQMFWGLDASQHADFFAELERIAGIQLCFQMAATVREITKRSDAGDYDAMSGFRTMLAHAQDYAESAAEIRTSDALRAIRMSVRDAKEPQP